ncbi:hypothetical protein GB937_009082 [Aspergillus fischeri]|nr:hypothetical protein GB937_009082 [Aspergillus fischeri]
MHMLHQYRETSKVVGEKSPNLAVIHGQFFDNRDRFPVFEKPIARSVHGLRLRSEPTSRPRHHIDHLVNLPAHPEAQLAFETNMASAV